MLNNKKNVRHILKCEINVIPFLDILLILLLIFIISTPVITHNFEVNLPTSSHAQPTKIRKTIEIIIEVLGNDLYNVSFNHNQMKNISSAQILSELNLKSNFKMTDATFLIAGSENIAYNDVIKTLNFLNKIGVSTVNILVKPI